MVEKNVVITYETLFELLRLEKSREDLQKLDQTFYEDVAVYIVEKRELLKKEIESSSMGFGVEETRIELENVRKILKDLYDRRERKIVTLALNKSKTAMTIVNTSAMLAVEKGFFDSLCMLFDSNRKILMQDRLFGSSSQNTEARIENMQMLIAEQTHQLRIQRSEEERSKQESERSNTLLQESEQASDNPNQDQTTIKEAKDLKSIDFSNRKIAHLFDEKDEQAFVKKVRFLAPIEEIVGPDLQIYGPYQAGIEIDLPKELAVVLIEKKHAEEIQ